MCLQYRTSSRSPATESLDIEALDYPQQVSAELPVAQTQRAAESRGSNTEGVAWRPIAGFPATITASPWPSACTYADRSRMTPWG